MRSVSDKSCRGDQNLHFVVKNFFPPEILAVYETVWKKYCRAGQTTDDSMAHAHCMLAT